jgi:Fic family protein
LQAVRTNGDWERWLVFFLRGVAEVATDAKASVVKIMELRESYRMLLTEEGGKATGTLLRLLDLLFQNPLINVGFVVDRLGIGTPTANLAIARFEKLAIIKEVTGFRRNRRFSFEPYLDLFKPTEAVPDEVPEAVPTAVTNSESSPK